MLRLLLLRPSMPDLPKEDQDAAQNLSRLIFTTIAELHQVYCWSQWATTCPPESQTDVVAGAAERDDSGHGIGAAQVRHWAVAVLAFQLRATLVSSAWGLLDGAFWMRPSAGRKLAGGVSFASAMAQAHLHTRFLIGLDFLLLNGFLSGLN